MRAAAREPCRTDVLFHYLLGPEDAERNERITRHGLLPLSVLPTAAKQADRVALLEELRREIAEPILGDAAQGTGVFFTPIDFRMLQGTPLHAQPRVCVSVERVDPRFALLTWHADETDRVVLPLSQETLRRAAAEWPAQRVRRWFGRDSTRIFWHVPQVVTYQPEAIETRSNDFES